MKELKIDCPVLEYYIMTTAFRIVTWLPQNRVAAGYKITPDDVLLTIQLQQADVPEATEENILAYFREHPEFFSQTDEDYILVEDAHDSGRFVIGEAFSALVAQAEGNLG